MLQELKATLMLSSIRIHSKFKMELAELHIYSSTVIRTIMLSSQNKWIYSNTHIWIIETAMKHQSWSILFFKLSTFFHRCVIKLRAPSASSSSTRHRHLNLEKKQTDRWKKESQKSYFFRTGLAERPTNFLLIIAQTGERITGLQNST